MSLQYLLRCSEFRYFKQDQSYYPRHTHTHIYSRHSIETAQCVHLKCNVSQIQTWDSCQSKNPQQFHTMRRSYVWGILYQLLVSYDLSIGSTVTKYIKTNTKTQNNIIISWIFLKKWFCYFGLFWNKMTEIQVFTKKSAGLVFVFLFF